MQKNILEYLEASAARLPDKTAFCGGKETLTFGEVLKYSRAVGSYLAKNGLCREGVLVYMDKRPAALCAFWGTVYAGCFYVCIDGSMPRARIDAIIEKLSPRAVIAERKYEQKACELSLPHTFIYEEICESGEDAQALLNIRLSQCDTDPIYVVFTSGSTGKPKGVAACHRSVIDYTESLTSALGFNEDTVFANQTPLYFDAPLKELMPTLKMGATTHFVPKIAFSFPKMLLDFLDEHKINTVCWVVSAFVQVSSLGALKNRSPKYLHTVAFGSEVFPREQYDIWRAALPNARFFNLYGPTEATGMSCYWAADRELSDSEPIPIGKPFDNTEILLIDGDGRLSSEGEICIRGTCVTLGYYNDAERTNEVFVQNPLVSAYRDIIYRTGDIGRKNEHSELVFVCRKDNQIKHMGHRIELGEIEAAASKCTGVRCAVCLYHAESKRIFLFVVGECEQKTLLLELSALLPSYMLPSVIMPLEALPLTDNGKTDRQSLKKLM